jgi:hypothetical protein
VDFEQVGLRVHCDAGILSSSWPHCCSLAVSASPNFDQWSESWASSQINPQTRAAEQACPCLQGFRTDDRMSRVLTCATRSAAGIRPIHSKATLLE